MEQKTIGFIGLGNMGKGMALNFARKGYSLVVFDVNRDSVKEVVEKGSVAAASNPGDVARQCDVTILSLPTPVEVRAVILGENGIIDNAKKEHVVIDTSTIDPPTSFEIAKTLREKEIEMLDAPVAGGGPKGAAVGKQMVIVGGTREVFDQQSDVLGVIGNRLFYAGENGKGLALKLCFNIYAGMSHIAASEAFVFGHQQGVDPKLIYDVINSAKKGDWILENKCPYPGCNGQSPADRDFEPEFFLDYALKDYGLVISTINRINAPYLMTNLTYQMFAAASKVGFGKKDVSAIVEYVKLIAGMKGQDK